MPPKRSYKKKRSARSAGHRREFVISQPHRSATRQQNRSQHGTSSVIATDDSLAGRPNENDDDDLDHVVMAIDMKERGTLGCAYYIAREGRLLCMEDVVDKDTEIFRKLTLDIQPTIVLISPTMSTLIQIPSHASELESDSNNPPSYEMSTRPPAEFGFDSALNNVLGLPMFSRNRTRVHFLVPGESNVESDMPASQDVGRSDRQGKLLRLNALVNLRNRIGVGCMGAVLKMLQKLTRNIYLPGDVGANAVYDVRHIETFSLSQMMLVNIDTLTALQIVQLESHPNSFKQGPGSGGSKESLSIYGIFQQYARTPQGKARLRNFFLQPTLNVEELNSRLDFISTFIRPENVLQCDQVSKSLSHIKNLRSTMTMLHKGVELGSFKYGSTKGGVWASLLDFCYHAIDIVETLAEAVGSQDITVCVQASECLQPFHLQRIGKMIHDVVDLEASSEQGRTVVKRGIDRELDADKDIYDSMEAALTAVAIDLASQLPPNFRPKLNVVYFPQLGFHIAVLQEEMSSNIFDIEESLAWERRFSTASHVYYKNNKMCEMDHNLGDLYVAICDREIELVYDLIQGVLKDEEFLVRASDICGQVDCLLALTHGARDNRLCRPTMVDDKTIDIKNGRHILQELTVPSYVPHDTYLSGGISALEDDSSLVLLTGPNYSGKSIYLKEVATIVYLAHVGSFVPATSAVIGLTDKILTRIATCETVSHAQSTFVLDLQQAAFALNTCTSRSLVVFDEFGKGTDSCDGAGLVAGLIRFLSSLSEPPRALIATHFHEIFDTAIIRQSKRVHLAHMEVCLAEDGSTEPGNESSIVYLYNLRAGMNNSSFGAQCARLNGMPNQIVNRAMELTNLMIAGEDLLTVCSVDTTEAAELEEAERIARDFLSWNLDDVDNPRALLTLGSTLSIDPLPKSNGRTLPTSS